MRWLLAAVALGWAGVAAAQLFSDQEARRRADAAHVEVQAAQDGLRRIEQRLATMESSMVERRAILDLAGQIDALRGELARSRGQIEVMLNQLEVAEKRQKDLYVDIDTRLRRLEQVQEQASAAALRPPADAGPTEAEKKTYESALNHFKLGNYSAAIDLLQNMLVAYPSSRLAPNAQYWIGMGHSGRRDYRNAILSHQKVIATWPDDPKAADAMLSISSAQEAMGDKKAAQNSLRDVLAKYPGSQAAASAKLRLAQSVKR